jgi:hypothetical protein
VPISIEYSVNNKEIVYIKVSHEIASVRVLKNDLDKLLTNNLTRIKLIEFLFK